MNQEEEKELLDKLLAKVETKYDQGVRSSWTDKKFRVLSEVIQSDAGVYLSPSTLKILFGKVKPQKENYSPQFTTKNALAKYVDSEDWVSFCKSQADLSTNTVKQTTSPDIDTKPKGKSKTSQLTIFTILLLGITIGIYLLLNKENTENEINLSEAKLSLTQKEGEAPFTVFASYNLPEGANPSDFHINFNDFTLKGNIQEALETIKGQQSHSFLFADVYDVQLVYKDSVIASERISVMSNGWKAKVSTKDYELQYYIHYKIDSFMACRGLYISPEQSFNKGISREKEYWTDIYRFEHFGINSNDFFLESTVRNNVEEGGFECNDIIISLSFERGEGRINLIGKGCNQWLKQQWGNQTIDGKKEDISMFCKDLSESTVVRVASNDHSVKIFIENELAYTFIDTHSLGELLGIEFTFKGSGVVENVLISSIEMSEPAIQENFGCK